MASEEKPAGAQARDAVDDFAVDERSVEAAARALDREDLTDVREVQVGVELGAGADQARFNALVRFVSARICRGKRR